MSYSLFANDKPTPAQPLRIADPQEDTTVVRMPELSKLIKLRDALLVLKVLKVLKVPLATSPGLRNLIERRLLNNDVYERVLGKLACDIAVHDELIGTSAPASMQK